MKTKNQTPYHCEDCRWWRYSRTDKVNVCINPESSYYGEDTAPEDCCIKYEEKEKKK